MLKEGKFGAHEAVCLATIAMSNKVFFTAPSYLTRTVGTAGWYMTIISCGLASIYFAFIYLLLKRFPGKNIIEIYDKVLGRLMGFVFSFILMGTFMAYSGIFSREFADVIKTYNFPITPLSVLTGAVIIVAGIAVLLGLEAIARTAKLAAYAALLGFILLIILVSPYFRFAHILPFMGYGIGKTVTTGVLRSTAYAEVFILAVFAGSLQGLRHIKKAGYISLLVSGLILSSGLLVFSLIFEYTSTVEITAPIYVTTRLMKFGNFYQRMEPIFLFVCIITTVIYVSILFYTTISIYCKMFRIQDRRPLIIPIGVLIFTVAIFPKDMLSVIARYIQGIRMLGNIPFFILPIIVLIVAVLRKKKGETPDA